MSDQKKNETIYHVQKKPRRFSWKVLIIVLVILGLCAAAYQTTLQSRIDEMVSSAARVEKKLVKFHL